MIGLALLPAVTARAVAAEEPLARFDRDDAAAEVRIEIDAGRPADFTLPRTLFGTFVENIWDATYGGLWAQVLHNPSFEPDNLSVQNVLDAARWGRLVTDPSFGSGYVRVEPLVEDGQPGRFVRSSGVGLPLVWEPLRPAGVRYEVRDGDAANSARSLLLMGLEGREVGVRQGVYLPAHRTLKYSGSLWAKTVRPAGEGVPLRVGVRRRNRPDEELVGTTVRVAAREWKRYEFAFELPPGGVAALEKIDFAIALGGEQRVLLDNVLLWPSDHVEGFDPEILEAARALRTPLLRFGGNFVSGYHWQDGVGDPEKRRTLPNGAWGLPEYNHFGTDEFLRFCRLIGAEPQICVNAGSGEADEAAAWVEYCNGPAASRYGAMRAANGRPEPYGVKLWEVGNELWGDFQIGWQTAASNARRYVEFAAAMKAADPGVRLIACGADVDFFEPWNAALIEAAGGQLDMVSTHLVIGMQPGEHVRREAPDDATHAADFAVPVGVGRKLDAMRAQFQADPQTRGRTRIAFTEWQFWSPRPQDPRFTNLGGAVNSAAFFHELGRRADFVPVSNMSNLVHFAGVHRQRGRVFKTPSYYVLKLYAESAGGKLVSVDVRGPGYDVRDGNRRVPDIADVPSVDALAVLQSDGETLRVYLVNRALLRDLPAAITLRGFRPAAGALLRRLSGPGIEVANTPEHPDALAVIESRLPDTGGDGLRLTLPKHSVTVVDLRRAR